MMQYCSRNLDTLVSEVTSSHKYENILGDFVRNIGLRELNHCRNTKEAVKATKNKLHLVAGAYFASRINYPQVLVGLSKAAADREKFRTACWQAMRCHASTRERLAILDEFYQHLFTRFPSAASILDIGCGLNPLAIPWMPFIGRVKYFAYDVYLDLGNFLNKFFRLVDIDGRAEVCDVIASPPKISADVAFVLKTIACLERIDRDAGVNLLERINARYLVVSFPVRSLCGKNKNMRVNYKTRFNAMARQKNWSCECLEFKSELVYLITKA